MISDHTPYNFPHGNGDPLHVFQHQNDSKTLARLQSVSVAVGEKLLCQREGTNSKDLFAVAVMTGEFIIGHEKFRSLLDGSTTNNFSVDLLDLRLIHTARLPQVISKKFLEEEIFAGTNFRELAFDGENRENFCLAKMSRYMVCPEVSLYINYTINM